jgi:WD40 repeat protein
MVLTGCRDGQARLWDITAGTPVVTLPHPGPVRCLGFRPGGGAFVTACADGPARLWHTATGLPIGEPLAHEAGVDCLAFRPDGTMVATGAADETIRLWCAGTGLPIGPPLAQGRPVRTLAFSPDGRRLAAGGPDATARCWTVPDPVEGDVERVACWVSVLTDLEFDAGDAIRRMDGSTSWDRRRRLTDLGGPPVRETDHRRAPRRDAGR